MNGVTAIVLAGSASPQGSAADRGGDALRAFDPVGGAPMLDRVLRALRDAPEIDRIAIVLAEDVDLAAAPAAQRAVAEGDAVRIAAAADVGASVVAALDALEGPFPALVVTADHALLTPALLAEFLAAAPPDADVAFALASEDAYSASFPQSRRTWLRFSEGAYLGCNLFLLGGPRARDAAKLWRMAGAAPKTPWRLARLFGLPAIAAYVLRRMSLADLTARVRTRFGLDVAPVILGDPQAAIDVNKPSDAQLAERLLAGTAIRKNMKIGLINNPLSRTNRAQGLARIDAMAEAGGAITAAESDTTNMAEILEDFARQGVELLAINGGDGTVREALTRIWRDRPFEKPPVLVVLRGGRSNAIAEDCGMRGAPGAAFSRLLEANRTGALRHHVVERPLLRVEGSSDGRVRYGMLFATAGAIAAIDFTRGRIDPLGLPVWLSDVLAVGGLITRQLFRPKRRYAFDGYKIAGEVDGVPLPFSRVALAFASTLDTLVLRARPYWDAQSGPIRFTMLAHPPKGALLRLPHILYGRAYRNLPEDRFFSRGAHEIKLRFEGRFVLDGEFYQATEEADLRLTTRDTVRFVSF